MGFTRLESFPETTWLVRTVILAGVNNLATEKLAMVASTVSSKMVQRMAHQEGFTFVECLTGTGIRLRPPVRS